MSSQRHTGIDTCLRVCVCGGGWGVSCVCVLANVYVCICHLHDRKNIFLASKDKNEVLKIIVVVVLMTVKSTCGYFSVLLTGPRAVQPHHAKRQLRY